jgi:hypothetical protein
MSVRSTQDRRISRRSLLVGGAAIAAGLIGWRRYVAHSSHPPRPPYRTFATGGSWGPLISIGEVAPVHVSMLPSGEVLATGTRNREYTADDIVSFSIDPRASGPVDPQPMTVPLRSGRDSLFCAGHSFLPDGRLLYVGGERTPPESGIDYGVLYEAAQDAWKEIGASLIGGPAWYPTATRLSTGEMLVISGFLDWGETPNRTMQVLEPGRLDSDGTPWRLVVPADRVPDVSPTGADYTHAFLLPRPLMVDGHLREVAMLGKTGRVHLFSAVDSFGDPAHRFATRPNGRRPAPATVSMPAAGASSVLLADGRIVIVGAGTEDGIGNPALASEAHTYDPARDEWWTIDTGIARAHPAAVLLPDATVLVVNGDGERRRDARRPQIIDPGSGAILTGPPWPDRSVRGYHNVALLVPDGRVLTGSGQAEARRRRPGPRERPDIRYYSPPYLSVLREEDRPKVLAAPWQMSYAEPYPIRFKGGQSTGSRY